MQNINLIKAGKIVGVHGIRGGVKILSYLENAENFKLYTNYYLDSQKIDLTINFIKGNVAVVHIEGVKKREDAEKLLNKEVYIDKNILPKVAENEFYYSDLVGLKVIDRSNGQEIGEVLLVENYGAGDVLEIKFNDERKNQLFAFTKKTFPKIDIEQGKIIFQLPDIEFLN